MSLHSEGRYLRRQRVLDLIETSRTSALLPAAQLQACGVGRLIKRVDSDRALSVESIAVASAGMPLRTPSRACRSSGKCAAARRRAPRTSDLAGHDFRPVVPRVTIYYNCSTTTVDPGRGMTTKPQDVVLSDLQIALMRVLWARGESSTAEVAEVLAGERGIKHTTVATMLTRLEKRGVVSLRRDARQVYYQARVSESEVRRSMVSELLGSLFGGDARALVSHLVDEAEIAPGDLEKLRKQLARGGREHE